MTRLSGLAFVGWSSDRFAKAGTARTPLTTGLRARRKEGSWRSASGQGSSGPVTEVDRGVIRNAGPHDPAPPSGGPFARQHRLFGAGVGSGKPDRTERRLSREARGPHGRFFGTGWVTKKPLGPGTGRILGSGLAKGVALDRASAWFGAIVAERQRSFPGSPFFGTEDCWKGRCRRRHQAQPSGYAAGTGRNLSGRGGNAGESGSVHVGRVVRTTATRPRFVSASRGQGTKRTPSGRIFQLGQRTESGLQGSSGSCASGPERGFPFRPAGPRQGAASGFRTVFRHRCGNSPEQSGFGDLPQGFRATWNKRPAAWFDRSRSMSPPGGVGRTGSIGPRCFARVTGMPIEKGGSPHLRDRDLRVSRGFRVCRLRAVQGCDRGTAVPLALPRKPRSIPGSGIDAPLGRSSASGNNDAAQRTR